MASAAKVTKSRRDSGQQRKKKDLPAGKSYHEHRWQRPSLCGLFALLGFGLTVCRTGLLVAGAKEKTCCKN